MQSLFNPLLLKAAMPNATDRNVARFAQELANTMARHDIIGPLRAAHFLAQVAHESGQLAFTEELASGAAYEGRADLGNVQPGDGIRFKGRGLIQITGRSNYQAYSHACAQDLLTDNNPARIAIDTALATDVAGWFWQVHRLNALADSDDVIRITRRINGGLNGLAQRQALLARAKVALGHLTEQTKVPAPVLTPVATKTPVVIPKISAVATTGVTYSTSAASRGTRQFALCVADGATKLHGQRKTGACTSEQYRNAA